MKILIQILVTVFFIFAGCAIGAPLGTNPQQNFPGDENDLSLSDCAIECTAVPDMDLGGGRLEAFVFYDNIFGPDGIAVLPRYGLLVVNEYGDPGPGVFFAAPRTKFSVEDAVSTIGPPLVSPDDIVCDTSGKVFVSDGQAQTVFRISRVGEPPESFVTASTTGSPNFNPYGLAIAPAEFDGINVDPGDLIIADNGMGTMDKAVWAVNPNTGSARIIAQGSVFIDGPLTAAFAPGGTLFIFENNDSGSSRIVTLSADGVVTTFLSGIEARGPMAIHPETGHLLFKKVEGEIYAVPMKGGIPQLLARNLGFYQDMVFNAEGTALYISASERSQVIQISAKK